MRFFLYYQSTAIPPASADAAAKIPTLSQLVGRDASAGLDSESPCSKGFVMRRASFSRSNPSPLGTRIAVFRSMLRLPKSVKIPHCEKLSILVFAFYRIYSKV